MRKITAELLQAAQRFHTATRQKLKIGKISWATNGNPSFGIGTADLVIHDILDHKFLNAVTIITIAISILIVSAFALFFINASDILSAWKKGIRIMAYLEPDIPHKNILELKLKIKRLYGVADVRFISRDEALQRMKDRMKRQSSLFANLKENPLPDAFENAHLFVEEVTGVEPQARNVVPVPLQPALQQVDIFAEQELGRHDE